MSNIKYLLKFGEKSHLDEFVKGTLYCSNAKTFWGIEDKLKIKGQGDVLEAGSRLFAQHITMRDYGSNETVAINTPSNVLVHNEPAEHIPIFCLFTVYDNDCELDMDGHYTIRLSKDKQETIKEHFPRADSVAIITEPKRFLKDVISSIGFEVKHEEVHYFHIDKGLEIKGSDQRAIDMEYMKYLTQDVPPIVENRKKTYVFRADYAYRALFCKDVFFKDEQEYRIVLPNEMITEGTRYPIKVSENIKIVPLEDFLK